jgi:pilus assembly protein Flp/PilA
LLTIGFISEIVEIRDMRTLIQKFRQDESGASMVEYGLLVALIAVVLIASVTSLGTGLQGVFDSIVAAFP